MASDIKSERILTLTLSNPDAKERSMSSPRVPTILCVDDEPTALTIRTLLLEHAGYKVVPAPDATAALKFFKSQIIDLVISDHLLPDLTGTELTLEMKLARPFVPVMLLSGIAELPQGVEHADVFMTKLGGPVELLEKVADLLRCSRVSEGNYFAEIRCDKRIEPYLWNYKVQCQEPAEIVSWGQAVTEDAAIAASRDVMRDLRRDARLE
jgi:DNA-binding response OmpR family regulator